MGANGEILGEGAVNPYPSLQQAPSAPTRGIMGALEAPPARPGADAFLGMKSPKNACSGNKFC